MERAEERTEVPAFTEFADRVFPGLEKGGFHAAYYRVLEAFARGRISG